MSARLTIHDTGRAGRVRSVLLAIAIGLALATALFYWATCEGVC